MIATAVQNFALIPVGVAAVFSAVAAIAAWRQAVMMRRTFKATCEPNVVAYFCRPQNDQVSARDSRDGELAVVNTGRGYAFNVIVAPVDQETQNKIADLADLHPNWQWPIRITVLAPMQYQLFSAWKLRQGYSGADWDSKNVRLQTSWTESIGNSSRKRKSQDCQVQWLGGALPQLSM